MLAYLPAAGILTGLLLFSLWNAGRIQRLADRWEHQLEQAEVLVQADAWPAAARSLQRSYQDWQRHQTYLHIVARHDTIESAQAMYRRALAFASARESLELLAELTDLRNQLRLLVETEQLSIRNIL